MVGPVSAAPLPTEPPKLPELRPELQLLPGAPDASGRPTWLVHDPLLNRFIQIDAAVYEALGHWRAGEDTARLIARAKRRTCPDGDSPRVLPQGERSMTDRPEMPSALQVA